MMPSYKGEAIPIVTQPAEWKPRAPLVSYVNDTEVVESLSTAEVRFVGRPRPLMHLRYTVQPGSARELGYLRKTLELAKATPVAVPLWTEVRRLTASVAIGATSIEHTSREHLSYEGRHWLLIADAFTWEVAETLPNGAFQISNLANPLEKAWPKGTAIVPLLFGWLPRPSTRLITDEAGRLDISFEERFAALGVELAPVLLDLGDGETHLDLGDGQSFLKLN